MITEIILLLFAIPVGFLIAWLAKDELVQGRKWFRLLVIASISLALLFWVFGFDYISLTLIFIAIVSLISHLKGKDNRKKGF